MPTFTCCSCQKTFGTGEESSFSKECEKCSGEGGEYSPPPAKVRCPIELAAAIKKADELAVIRKEEKKKATFEKYLKTLSPKKRKQEVKNRT